MEDEYFEADFEFLVYDPVDWADECARKDYELKQKLLNGEEEDESYAGRDGLSCESVHA